MKRKTFITACSFRAPGLTAFEDIIIAMNHPGFTAAFQTIRLSDRLETNVARLAGETASPHYPSGSKLKLMRTDVIAAIICAGELMEQAGLDAVDILDLPLYISNGSSFDLGIEQLLEITSAYMKQSAADDWSKRYQRVYASLPPMYVLRTLANAAECFVAQKTGARGDNATFGGSSHATFLALQEVLRKIESHEAEMAVLGTCNGIGIFSAFTFGSPHESGFQWRESEGAGFLLIESEASLSRSGRRPMAELAFLEASKTIPDIFSDARDETPYREFHNDLAEYCIYSGGLSGKSHETQARTCEKKWQRSFSWFHPLGNMGNNAILINMATAIALFKQGDTEQVDCVNRDSHGRESLIKLQAFGG